MTCGSCADKLHASLMKLDGVNAATISHETGKADVSYDAEKVTVDAIIAIVTTGITATITIRSRHRRPRRGGAARR